MKLRNFIFLPILCIVLTACGNIDTGHVGVRTTFGQVSQNPENPGFYIAILSHVDEYSAKQIAIDLKNMTPKAKDNLNLEDLDLTVYYEVAPSKIPSLATKYSGQSIFEHSLGYPGYVLVENLAKAVTFDEVAKHDSMTIHLYRQEVEADIKSTLQAELNQSDPSVFTITRVAILQAKTDRAVEESIVRAVTVQKEVEAKKQQIELAKAEATRAIAEAGGIAQSNQMVAASISKELVEYKKAEAMQTCAATSGCAMTLIVGNATPLINVK